MERAPGRVRSPACRSLSGLISEARGLYLTTPVSSSSSGTGRCSESHPSGPKAEQISVTNWFRFELGSLWVIFCFLAQPPEDWWGRGEARIQARPFYRGSCSFLPMLSWDSEQAHLWTGQFISLLADHTAGHRKKKERQAGKEPTTRKPVTQLYACCVHSGSTWNKAEMIRVVPVSTQTCDTSRIFSGVMKKFWRWILVIGEWLYNNINSLKATELCT